MRHAPIQAAKFALINHCVADAGTEISEGVMVNAIAMAAWLVRQSAATAIACISGDRDRIVGEEAATMLEKLEHFGRPAWPRELFRKYSNQSKGLHEPTLELLLRRGQARRLPNGSIEAAGKTDGLKP